MERIGIVLFVLACFGLGCATTSSIEYGNVDFSKHHSYAWTEPDHFPNDEGLARSPVLNPHITQLANEILAIKGFAVDVENPDLIAVSYLVPILQNNIGRGDESPVREKNYTLVLEFYDPYTNDRLWRGWATVSVNAGQSEYMVLDRVKEERGDLSQSVRRILDQFPAPKR